jgi:hypothetical protein
MHAVNGIRSGNFVPFSLLLAAAFLCVAVRTKAIEPLGDNSELFITGVVTVSENDNIFLSNSNPTSSEITDLTPGLSYEFGKTDSQTQGQVAYYEDFQFFSKSGSQLDNQLGNFVFSTKYDDAKTKLNLDATWHQADEAEVGYKTWHSWSIAICITLTGLARCRSLKSQASEPALSLMTRLTIRPDMPTTNTLRYLWIITSSSSQSST